MDYPFDLAAKPLARALISSAVKSMDPVTVPDAGRAPITHQDLLQLGITRTAQDISDAALLLLGRSSIASSAVLPVDAFVVIGFSSRGSGAAFQQVLFSNSRICAGR